MYETSGQMFTQEEFEQIFPIIDISELIGHKLLEHEPQTEEQKRLLGYILKGIEIKLPPFRVPIMDPSLEKGRIVFKPGLKPAVGHSAKWWNESWGIFLPSKNSRSATELHWSAVLGNLMMHLVDDGYSVAEAWEGTCDDSRNLGHYWNSDDAKHYLEPTGSRKVGSFYDLANTCKVLKEWSGFGYFLAGGYYGNNGKACPLADIEVYYFRRDLFQNSVGLLVMDV